MKLKATQSVSGLFCILPSFYREPEGHKDFFPRTTFQFCPTSCSPSDPYELHTFNRCMHTVLFDLGCVVSYLKLWWFYDRWIGNSKFHKSKKKNKINKQTSLCHFCSYYCKMSMSQTKHQAPGPGCSFSHVDSYIIAKLRPQSPSVLTLVSERVGEPARLVFVFFYKYNGEDLCRWSYSFKNSDSHCIHHRSHKGLCYNTAAPFLH